MEHIVEVMPDKISEIRGYMANSGGDCASRTCDCGSGPDMSAEYFVARAFEEVPADFFI